MLHAVTFDFWGTLYHNAPPWDKRLHLLAGVLARHSQPRPWTALEAAHRHASSVRVRIWREEHRSITTERWLREILAFLKADLPEDVLVGLCRPIEEIYLHGDAPQPVPGVAEVLPRLSRRYHLGLISNVGLTPGRVLRELLRRDALEFGHRGGGVDDEGGLVSLSSVGNRRQVRTIGLHQQFQMRVGIDHFFFSSSRYST